MWGGGGYLQRANTPETMAESGHSLHIHEWTTEWVSMHELYWSASSTLDLYNSHIHLAIVGLRVYKVA